MLKDCCVDSKNLETKPDANPDVTVKVCKVCGCRHFELILDTGKLGFEGKSL